MIWIFNIYSWVVSAVLCSDGVLSVPATKAFSESQAFYNFPCKFLLVLFHAASTKATKAEALQLCFVWHLIPYPRQCVVTQLGDNQIHVLPLFPGLKCAFAVRQPWRFSQDCRELDTWDVFGLLSHLASTLISSYSIGSGEWVSNPIQHNPTQWGTSRCPVWTPRSDTSWVIWCASAGGLSAGLLADLQVCLGSCPVCCSACDRARGLPEKRIWCALRMKIFQLGVLLESCCKTLQRTWFDCFKYLRTVYLGKL